MNPVLRVAGLAVLIMLAGCSTPPPDQEDKVATLETTGSAPTSVSSVAPPPSRPRERLDMTNDELIEQNQAYNDCLSEHLGGKGAIAGDAEMAPRRSGTPEEMAAAETACLPTKPLPPWEYDIANPESADFLHAVVQCLRDKGVRYVDEEPATPGDDRRVLSFGGQNNDQESISKGLSLIGTCEKEQTNR
ncbi:hypothetical protein [Actinophytocola sediminis]